AALEIRFVLYTIFGAITCISSLICLIVFLSTKELRKKYVMFSALSVGDFLNGLSFVLAGTFRTTALIQGFYYQEVSGMECLLRTPWGLMMVIAGQIPALLHLFVALDRVAALQFAAFYRRQPLMFQKQIYVALTGSLTLLFIILAVALNLSNPVVNMNRICAVMNSTGIYYGTIHFSLIAITYIFCFVILWNLFRKSNKRRAPTGNELRRQRMILSLDFVSVLLVSIPNLALILDEWKAPDMNTLTVGTLYCLYAIHSSIPLFIYIYFRIDFRLRFYYLFGWQAHLKHYSTSEKSAVAPVAPKTLYCPRNRIFQVSSTLHT
ncbi:hypothetical protein V3C99_003582, partial [Haemonchus contortus]